MLGGLLVLGALVAGLARRSFLSLTALFVVAGFVLGQGALDVLHFDPRSGFVNAIATVALIVILFRDGLEVEAEMLQRAWHVPLRALAIAMPLTGALVGVVTHAGDRPHLDRVAARWARCSPPRTPCSPRRWSRTRACRA